MRQPAALSLAIIDLRAYARVKERIEAKDAKVEDFTATERALYQSVLLRIKERLIDGR